MSNLRVLVLSNLSTGGGKLSFIRRDGRSGGTATSVWNQRLALSNRSQNRSSVPKRSEAIV